MLELRESLAIGLNDYEVKIFVDAELKKITKIIALEDINEEGINIKTGNIVKSGNKTGISYKEVLADLFQEMDEDGNITINIK